MELYCWNHGELSLVMEVIIFYEGAKIHNAL